MKVRLYVDWETKEIYTYEGACDALSANDDFQVDLQETLLDEYSAKELALMTSAEGREYVDRVEQELLSDKIEEWFECREIEV